MATAIDPNALPITALKYHQYAAAAALHSVAGVGHSPRGVSDAAALHSIVCEAVCYCVDGYRQTIV